MVAGEAALSMQKERDMVHDQELDKLGAGLLQDILQARGMKLRRPHMPTVLPPSCSYQSA